MKLWYIATSPKAHRSEALSVKDAVSSEPTTVEDSVGGEGVVSSEPLNSKNEVGEDRDGGHIGCRAVCGRSSSSLG